MGDRVWQVPQEQFVAAWNGFELEDALQERFGRPTRVLIVAALVVQWVLAVIAGTTLDLRIFGGVLLVFGALLYALLVDADRPKRATPAPEQPPQSTPSAA